MGRETTTGRVLEETILPALRRAGYTWAEQTCIGCRPGGRKHKVDLVATRDGLTVLVSMKWQEASGTAEQKVPFEVMCLADALKEGDYAKAYLVLAGLAGPCATGTSAARSTSVSSTPTTYRSSR